MIRFPRWTAVCAAAASMYASPLVAQNTMLVLWEVPPTIGAYSPSLEILSDGIPGEATSEWPEFTPAVVAELAACSGLEPLAIADWSLRTVDAPLFYVIVSRDGMQWESDGDFIGFTFPRHHRIYVVQAGVRSRALVKHELLHAMMEANGLDGRHNTPLADGLFAKCLPEKVR